jgi:hypothetical protein
MPVMIQWVCQHRNKKCTTKRLPVFSYLSNLFIVVTVHLSHTLPGYLLCLTTVKYQDKKVRNTLNLIQFTT